MNIQLLSPAGEIHRRHGGIFKSSLRYAPLTLTTLAALVPEELDATVTIQDEGAGPLDLDFPTSLVGITAITGTALRCYEIADQLRAKGHTVILGGVHPTLLPEEAAEHADCVVVGYAEETWPTLLRDYQQGKLQPQYTMSPCGTLEGLPHARRDMLNRKKYATINTIEAVRGCPHKCSFCAVPAAWPGLYLKRPIKEVIAEMETFEGRNMLFIDLSPTEDVEYVKELYRAMIPLRKRWVGLSTTRIGEDPELLKLASQSGCRGVLIGFEGIQQETLSSVSKGFHTVSDYADVVARLHDHGIAIQGCFVFGLDVEDDSVFEKTVEFVDRTKIDLPRYAAVTPFPNTALYRQLEQEGRLLHKDWSLYDVEHVVFRPKQMSPERLQEGLNWAWRQSYSARSIARRMRGARWSSLPVWIPLNLGYRFFARRLHTKT
jgi:radical SAM superfamily enzyme YgiQ (UPF0313 family)